MIDRKEVMPAIRATVATDGALTPLSEGSSYIYDYKNRFDQVAERLYSSFLAAATEAGRHEELPLTVIEHGYNIVARGINKCRQAYTRYCQGAGQPYDQETLVAALAHPETVGVFTFLANMPNRDNRWYEAQLGLLSTSADEANYWGGEFVFNPNSGLFHMDETIAAEGKVARLRHQLVDGKQQGACPAQDVIPAIWHATLAVCQEEGLLAAHGGPAAHLVE